MTDALRRLGVRPVLLACVDLFGEGGVPDSRVAEWCGVTEDVVRKARSQLGIKSRIALGRERAAREQ